MTKQGEMTRKPGTILIGLGVVLVLISLLLCGIVLSQTHTDYNPVTFAENTVQGTPTPTDILIGVVGLVLAVIGFAQRLLAAVERR